MTIESATKKHKSIMVGFLKFADIINPLVRLSVIHYTR